MGVNAATSGGADVIFMDLDDTFGSGLSASLHTFLVHGKSPPLRPSPPPPLYQAGVINITVGMFFIMGSDMLFFMGSARYSPRIAV